MRIRIMLIILITLLLTCSCSANRSDAMMAQNRSVTNIREGQIRTYTRHGEFRQTNEPGTRGKSTDLSDAERAYRIRKVVEDIDEVNKASVVIHGNNAIVGIELNGKPTDSHLVGHKNEVERKVKSVDGDVDHVTVTADAELVRRVTDLAEGKNLFSGSNP